VPVAESLYLSQKCPRSPFLSIEMSRLRCNVTEIESAFREKKQAIYGRVFKNVEEVRKAVEAFLKQYNEMWLTEKLGFRSPAQASRDLALRPAA